MRLNDQASSGWLLRALGCTSAIVLCFYFVGAWLGRALGPMKEVGRSVQCQGNVRLLAQATRMYADDYDDRLPPAPHWMDRIDFFLDAKSKGAVHCPEVGTPVSAAFGYALNGELAGKPRAKVEDFEKLPLLFDSPDLSPSAVAKGLVLPNPGRHIGHEKKGQPIKRGNYVGLGGGGVRFQPDAKPEPNPSR